MDQISSKTPRTFLLDDGCEVNAIPGGCLSCPLPLCRYDDEGGFHNWRNRQRRERKRTLILAPALKEV